MSEPTPEDRAKKQLLPKQTLAKAAAGALALGTAMVAGLGQEPRVAEADSPTPSPTPSPVGTPTPDALGTQIARQRAENARLAEELRKREELTREQATTTVIAGQLNRARGTPTPPPATPTPNPEEERLKRIDEAVVKELADRRAAVDTGLAERQAKMKELDEAIARANQRLANAELEADAARERRLTDQSSIQDAAVPAGAGAAGFVAGGLLAGRIWRGMRGIGGAVSGIVRRRGGGTPPAGPAAPPGP